MDFHTLSRRDLQALCKRNKIPANMTNVAMAEALQSLQNVEGLEEVLANPSIETPARSVAASNRQRTVREDTVTSKLTRTNRGTRKADEEAAAPSAGLKVSMAQSALKNAENSAIQQGYSTRRSTRLLEKQMCQLTLKENDDMADAKAIIEKDSQDMQRQFSADMESSLDLNDETTESDETDVTKEASKEPIVVEAPLQYMETVLENEMPTPEKCNQVENVGHVVEEPNLVDVPVQHMDEKSLQVENQVADLEKSSNQEKSKDDEAQPMQEDSVDSIDAVDVAQSALSVAMIEKENTSTELPVKEFVEQNAVAAVNTVIVDEQIVESEDTVVDTESVVAEVVQSALDTRSPVVSEDEFDFLSDSESESSESLSEEVDIDSIVSTKISESTTDQSSCKSSDENQEKLSLQDENMAAVGTATPIENKTMGQLRKMLKEKKQALKVRQVNV